MTSLNEIIAKYSQFIKERNWDQFNSPKDLSMALAVEASELMENFMWLKDHQVKDIATQFPHLLANAKEEVADVFLYLIRIAQALEIDLLEVAEAKMHKNALKYPIEKGRALAEALKN